MSVWSRFTEVAASLFGARAQTRADSMPARIAGGRPDVDFAAAVIALGAKMARADGITTQAEAMALRRAFPVAPSDVFALDQLFQLAQETVHGFEGYAKRLARRFANSPELLADVLDVLFAVAVADAVLTREEEDFLKTVARLFGIDHARFEFIARRHLPDRPQDPYSVLGVTPSASSADIRSAWLKGIAEAHPDRFIGRGGPVDFVAAANARAAALNTAYEALGRPGTRGSAHGESRNGTR
jgi:DnaJ like chaperone protein